MSRGVIVGIVAGVVVVLAALAFVFLRPKPTEVTTVVAESETSGPALGNSVLNASGYVVARRMSTVSSKVTGKIAEIFVEEGMDGQEGPGAREARPGELADRAHDGRA